MLRKPTVGQRHSGSRGIELRGRQRGGERYPAAPTAAQQRQEVQVGGQLPATLNLVDADLHGLLVERSLVAHPPSQVDGLKSPPAHSAVVLQRTERALLQCPALVPHLGERRAHEHAKQAGRPGHGSSPRTGQIGGASADTTVVDVTVKNTGARPASSLPGEPAELAEQTGGRRDQA
jgi:hypothetical protein